MYIRYIISALVWAIAMLTGFIGYFAVKHTGIGDSIWGNSVDGLGGDASYKRKEAQWWLMPVRSGAITGFVASLCLLWFIPLDWYMSVVALPVIGVVVFNALFYLGFREFVAEYNWTCIRNPANNLLRHTLNAEGIITCIEKYGNMTIVTLHTGKRYFFFYNRGGKHLVKLGWRFWSDQIKVGEHYNASFVLNP